MYKINSVRLDSQTLWSNVTYIMNDGTPITVDVPVFMPQDADVVVQSLKGREATEKNRYEYEKGLPVIEAVKVELDKLVGISQGE